MDAVVDDASESNVVDEVPAKMSTVLITGFGPFPGAPFNPTQALVRRLGARRRPALADVELITHVFRTRYGAIDEELPRLIARHRPDVLLMFGLAARSRELRVETRARNAVSALVPDAGGRISRSNRIRAGQPPALAGRAPFQKLVSVARAARIPARLSRDAGSYLCNYLYWHGCEGTAGHAQIPVVAFVHVPLVRRAARPRGRRRARTLADLTRAGEAILLTLVSAARARRLG
ncbi:MAG: pyroglutamyl-peptidase I [Xanthobacteraceae bacterium]